MASGPPRVVVSYPRGGRAPILGPFSASERQWRGRWAAALARGGATVGRLGCAAEVRS